jgi:hypothetical protein
MKKQSIEYEKHTFHFVIVRLIRQSRKKELAFPNNRKMTFLPYKKEERRQAKNKQSIENQGF